MPALPRTLSLPDEGATAAFAARLGAVLDAGDTLLLSGPIGAGKSAFARALIRARLGADEDVPSPTFTLVQVYGENPEIWHCDLYRLGHVDEVMELGLEEAFEHAICLVEWPDRLGPLAPEQALNLAFAADDDGHRVTIAGPDPWPARIEAAGA